MSFAACSQLLLAVALAGPVPVERSVSPSGAGSVPALPSELSDSWVLARAAGEILSAARPPDGGPHEDCLLTLAVPGAPRTRRALLAVCVRGDAIDFLVPGQAPDRAEALAAEAAGGRTRVLLGVPGGVDEGTLAADGRLRALRSVLRDARIHPRNLDDRPDLDGDGRADLLQSLATGLGAWRQLEDGTYRALESAVIAGAALVGHGRVEMRGRDFGAGIPPRSHRWATPRHAPPDRLAVTRVPLTSAGAGTPCTAWLRSGEPRSVTGWIVSEAPASTLVAATVRADRAELLGEHRLVIAPLACDDTGRGRSLSLDVETPYPNFDPPKLQSRDVTGDDLPDVIALGVAGRLRPKVVVSAWPALPDGSYARRPRRWSWRVERGTRPIVDWTEDVTGDDRPDMLILDESGVTVFEGRPADGRSVPLATRPSGRYSWEGTLTGPRLIGYVRSRSGSRPVVVGERLTRDGDAVDDPLLVLGASAPRRGE